jgi:hypothetical protein
MKKCKNTLEKSIEQILYFENKNSIEEITKIVFETILKAERKVFLVVLLIYILAFIRLFFERENLKDE